MPLHQNKASMSKKYTQSHFVHMVQTLPVSSNSEVLITFTREFGINPLVRDEIYITYDLFFAITSPDMRGCARVFVG